MEYQENNLKSREELAKMAMDMIDAHLCYTGSIRSGASKEEDRYCPPPDRFVAYMPYQG